MGTAGAREVMLGMAENWLIKEPPGNELVFGHSCIFTHPNYEATAMLIYNGSVLI